MFACEQNPSVRHLLYQTYGKKARTYYSDDTTRRHADAPKVGTRL